MKLLGNSAKDSKYLKRIKDAIEHNALHPRNNGVKMQAHHAISGEGMKRSGLGKKIEGYGYDINLLPNLVFIPCTLQGACYLGVQPHRGNHTARIDQDNYDDDLEPKSYHDMVSSKLIDLQLPLARACETMDKAEDVQHKLDKLSKDIVALIQKKPSAAPLTNIAKHFAPKNPVGCSGVDSVQLHKGLEPCGVGRVHVKNKQCATQKPENIVFRTETPYKLQPGR